MAAPPVVGVPGSPYSPNPAPAQQQPPVQNAGASVMGKAAGNLQGLSPKQIQKLLKAKGYNVVVDGKMGPNTKTAMDAYIHGKPPHQYNTWWAKQAGAGASVAGKPVGAVGAAVQGANAKVKPKANSLQALADISSSIGVPIPQSMADQLVSGDTAAIKVIQDALNKQPGQATQNEHDIQHWYGQVLDALSTATTRDAEIGNVGAASIADATGKITASLGGSANPGAANVAAAGATDAGALTALSTVQDQYNQDVAPLLQSEAAGASSRQKALDAASASALQNKMIEAVGTKGTDRAKALMDIMSHNDQLAQQGFQNSLALQQEKDAQKALGMKTSALNIPKPLSPTQLTHVAGMAYSSFLDPNGQLNIKGKSVQQIVKQVNDAYLAAGLDLGNPQVAESAMGTLRHIGITPDPAWYGVGG